MTNKTRLACSSGSSTPETTSTLTRIALILNTVKHLKSRQIAGQVIKRVRGCFEDPERLLRQRVPPTASCHWPLGIDVLPPGMQENAAQDILSRRMSFLNRTEQIGWMPNWQSESPPKLWQYNLHYFEWLWALQYDDARAVVHDWIENHKPAKRQQGWEPYPTSLRLMNLCGVFFAKYRTETEKDATFRDQLWKSLYLQSEWLMRHLETHLLANHYLENGAALAFVGSCFDGPTAERWLSKGTDVLASEIPAQILSDGMHFELSPMYHGRALYVLAILQATSDPRITKLVSKPIERMCRALDLACHPDGHISLMSDSAFGIYNDPEQLITYCRTLGANTQAKTSGAFELPEAGYYGWRDQCGNYLICDAGPIGPDYQPAHAHADMFTYELSLNNSRVIVDTGVHDYENTQLRRYSRSTAAHNTVEINEADQCEMWGVFRVARRGYPTAISWDPTRSGFSLSGSHTGYKRLAGRPQHKREIKWDAKGTVLSVCDRITAMKSVRSVSRIHLHPDCSIKKQTDLAIRIEHPTGEFEIRTQNSSRLSVTSGWYFPEFGKKIKNTVVAVRSEGSDTEINYDVRPVPVDA